MFDPGSEEIVVLLLVALFVLGPERLPAAVTWLGRKIRKVKEFAAVAGE
jgi:sec-independent protein translocase protein TatB